MNKLINNEEVIIKEVKSLIEESKHKIVSYVNTTLLFTYWNIGKKIIEYQGGKEKAKYGDKFIERLSKELTNEYGKGFDVRKLNADILAEHYGQSFVISFSEDDISGSIITGMIIGVLLLIVVIFDRTKFKILSITLYTLLIIAVCMQFVALYFVLFF